MRLSDRETLAVTAAIYWVSPDFRRIVNKMLKTVITDKKLKKHD